jgi:2-keto-4-pentenoate hydratase/2-oxohepta-3-ene-1,7-dioic acid hydratase in catechol pathway
MRLVSYFANGRERFGALLQGQIVDFSSHGADSLHAACPNLNSVLGLIEAGAEGIAFAETLLARYGRDPSSLTIYSTDEVAWRAPVLRPSKLCCVAFNNTANSGRIMTGPRHPALFTKPASALIGHLSAIECRPEYGRVHPEPGLAVIIGRQAKHVSAEDAYDYAFGYTIHNDITSPTMRERDTFHYRAIHPRDGNHKEIAYRDSWVSNSGRYKGSDTFACLGPCIVTKDEIADPHALTVTCLHQDILITEDNTENLIYKIPQLLEFITRYMTLEPGDIVSMGTALKKSAEGGAVQNIDLNRLGGPISVADIEEGTRLVDEEQFGPVLPIIRYSDVEDAVRRANGMEYGLDASVWGRNRLETEKVARKLEAGTVWINQHAQIAPHVPMGGIKSSGIGVEFGEEGLAAYTTIKIINAAA